MFIYKSYLFTGRLPDLAAGAGPDPGAAGGPGVVGRGTGSNSVVVVSVAAAANMAGISGLSGRVDRPHSSPPIQAG